MWDKCAWSSLSASAMTCRTCRVSRGSVAAARPTAVFTTSSRFPRPFVVCRITDTCWLETRPSPKACSNCGKDGSSAAAATIADPACTVAPVAPTTNVPVVPAPRTRESRCASLAPATEVRYACSLLVRVATAAIVPARSSAHSSSGSGRSATSSEMSSRSAGCSVGSPARIRALREAPWETSKNPIAPLPRIRATLRRGVTRVHFEIAVEDSLPGRHCKALTRARAAAPERQPCGLRSVASTAESALCLRDRVGHGSRRTRDGLWHDGIICKGRQRLCQTFERRRHSCDDGF